MAKQISLAGKNLAGVDIGNTFVECVTNFGAASFPAALEEISESMYNEITSSRATREYQWVARVNGVPVMFGEPLADKISPQNRLKGSDRLTPEYYGRLVACALFKSIVRNAAHEVVIPFAVTLTHAPRDTQWRSDMRKALERLHIKGKKPDGTKTEDTIVIENGDTVVYIRIHDYLFSNEPEAAARCIMIDDNGVYRKELMNGESIGYDAGGYTLDVILIENGSPSVDRRQSLIDHGPLNMAQKLQGDLRDAYPDVFRNNDPRLMRCYEALITGQYKMGLGEAPLSCEKLASEILRPYEAQIVQAFEEFQMREADRIFVTGGFAVIVITILIRVCNVKPQSIMVACGKTKITEGEPFHIDYPEDLLKEHGRDMAGLDCDHAQWAVAVGAYRSLKAFELLENQRGGDVMKRRGGRTQGWKPGK